MPILSESEGRTVRFGVFELDVRSGELRKGGTRLTVQGQPLQLLTVLLEQPGEVVTRDQLRKRLWPADTFVDFEHGLNAAVKRLRDTLGDSADTPRFIETLPRRGYRFIAPVQRLNDAIVSGQRDPISSHVAASSDAAAGADDTARLVGPVRRDWTPVVVAIGVAAVATAGWLAARTRTPNSPMQVVPLTQLSGTETWPTFSPDGTQVAFSWDGEKKDNVDVYVMLVGSTEVRRLTTDPAPQFCPRWSPDGRQIAYLSASSGNCLIHLMSALGGADLKLSDLAVGSPITWSPDGRYIVATVDPGAGQRRNGLYLFPVSGGEPRPLILATLPQYDYGASFSPDGRQLSYVSCSAVAISNCDVFLLDLDRTFTPTGRARRLTRQASFQIVSTAWTRDGRFVVYDVWQGAPYYLWRVAADGREPPERIEAAGAGALWPATARSLDRLAFSRDLSADDDVYRFDVGGSSRPLVTSSAADDTAQFSPDGRRVTFCSTRSGVAEVWVAAADGSAARQITHGPGRLQCSPHWSADSQRIAFDSQADDGHWHIWTIEAAGGIPEQLTNDPGDQTIPSWSRDGQWIYFSWDQAGARDIWRIRVHAGLKERITKANTASFRTLVALESSDEKSVLYQPKGDNSALVAVPLAGGIPRQVIPCVADTAFSPGPRGIYYLACGPGSAPEVHLMNPVTGVDRVMGKLDGFQRSPPSGFSVSPDGTSIIYTKQVGEGADLMLIEHFR